MKQRILVQALIRNDHNLLLLRRAKSSGGSFGEYELPGGRIDSGEQPEDALRRNIRKDTGLDIKASELVDSLTLRDDGLSDINNVFLIYKVEVTDITRINLSEKYDKYMWLDGSKFGHNSSLRSSATAILDALSQPDSRPVQVPDSHLETKSGANESKSSYASGRVIIYSDGGSRGNPGPSASGFVIFDENEQLLERGGEYLGITTNNQAEYHGVRLGLEKALGIGAKTVDFRMDSLLVANQLKGIYAIKSKELWPIHERIKELAANFDKVTFSHVPRENNRLADAVVNDILDSHKDNKR